MHREFFQHKIAYSILVLGLVVAIFGFLGAWPNVILQRAVIAGLVLFYFIWGVTVHRQAGNLSRKLIEEYAAVAIFAGALLLIITF